MMSPGDVGGLTPSKLLVRPKSDVMRPQSATDANCRASFGSSQLLRLPLLSSVSLSVSSSPRRRPLIISFSQTCSCHWPLPL